MRSFIAVELPEALRRSLGHLQDELRESKADVKWVRPASIHLTLKFLGEIDPAMVGDIRQTLEGIVPDYQPFLLDVGGLGCFPQLRRPRVVWVGLSGDLDRLLALQRQVENGMARLGFLPEDRPFRPHLTLGRVRSNRGREKLLEKVQGLLGSRLGDFTVQSVVQFQSELHPAGARYTPLWELPLGNPGG